MRRPHGGDSGGRDARRPAAGRAETAAEQSGRPRARPGTASHSAAGRNNSSPDRTSPDRTGSDRDGPDRVGRGDAVHDRAGRSTSRDDLGVRFLAAASGSGGSVFSTFERPIRAAGDRPP